ncbi:MAG: hypothetical protein QNJ14_10725 [Woeseiaceae bacterium]|nr:hypothetical protein [Woeseiaceae bacterium]
MRRSWLLLLVVLPALASAETTREIGGYTKFRLIGTGYPDNSAWRSIVGAETVDVAADLRLNLKLDRERWAFDSSWQLVGLNGEGLLLNGPPDDDRRLFDLSDVISDGSQSALLHRLDRLWVGYTSEKAVVRLGRQALSWGNGLAYAPMDLVNPFDPASIDTEYKAGDDMLYLQYLQDNGNDVQAAWVARRDPQSGDVDADQATLAVKYHGSAGTAEYDLLVAENYGDPVLGFGFGRDVGGAVWSMDLVLTDTDLDTYAQLVTNVMYSWVWRRKNVSGSLEYFYNGFGISGGSYDPQSLANRPDLVMRAARGELFTLGRHYVAANLLVEVTPLWSLTPTLFLNAEDPSALFQLVTNYSLSDEMTLLGSVNLPLGPSGSEFGGIETGLPDSYLSSDGSVFIQFAWYF